MILRKALKQDIPIIAAHHKMMFQDMMENENSFDKRFSWEDIEKAQIKKLELGMERKDCILWVAELNGEIAASGGVSLVDLVPTPDDILFTCGFIHSVYTLKEYRKKGIAEKILDSIIEYCKLKGIKKVFLNSSEQGRALYDKKGFFKSERAMKYFIE